ncbi:MAG TPA: FAD-dependent oxidoreductase, partial [Tepidisphaeraceae bacterium]|nr:FAD-dependent oxidoreductase [Tepidisphaeraceae bacterium]
GRQAVVGKVFVDCTADADVAASAGATFDLALPTDEESWQTSIDLTVANIDPEKVLRWCAENREKLQGGGPRNDPAEDHGGVRLGFALHLTNGNYHYVKKAYGDAHPAELESHQGEGNYPTLKLMVRRTASRVQGNVEIDGTDVRQITWAEIEGRRRAYANLEYLRRTIPGCEDAFVVGDNPLGVRVSRRVHGEYRVTIDDLVGNARFDDVVALNARVIDKHLAGDKTEFTYLPGNHDVPLRALLPRGQVNLLVGGRCLSCDEQSHGSLRGAATCWATGHAAGAAAAVAARDAGGRVRGVDVGDVQRLLLGQGAILSTSGQTFPAGATGGALAAVAGGTH